MEIQTAGKPSISIWGSLNLILTTTFWLMIFQSFPLNDHWIGLKTLESNRQWFRNLKKFGSKTKGNVFHGGHTETWSDKKRKSFFWCCFCFKLFWTVSSFLSISADFCSTPSLGLKSLGQGFASETRHINRPMSRTCGVCAARVTSWEPRKLSMAISSQRKALIDPKFDFPLYQININKMILFINDISKNIPYKMTQFKSKVDYKKISCQLLDWFWLLLICFQMKNSNGTIFLSELPKAPAGHRGTQWDPGSVHICTGENGSISSLVFQLLTKFYFFFLMFTDFLI